MRVQFADAFSGDVPDRQACRNRQGMHRLFASSTCARIVSRLTVDLQADTDATARAGDTALLAVEGLTRSFYGVKALIGASFSVAEQTIAGLIGPNGAGKTTVFNCVSGVIPPDGGRITFDGTDITGWRPEDINRRGLVRTFQITRGFPRLTVLETLLVHGEDQPGERLPVALFTPKRARVREEELTERAAAIAKTLNLSKVLNNLSSDLSGGQKKLLEIGRALMARPKLILLDEPVAGVNPTLAGEIAERIAELRDTGLTFLVVEHDMDVVARLCDPVIVMAGGCDLTTGSFDDIVNDRRVQDAYLGKRT